MILRIHGAVPLLLLVIACGPESNHDDGSDAGSGSASESASGGETPTGGDGPTGGGPGGDELTGSATATDGEPTGGEPPTTGDTATGEPVACPQDGPGLLLAETSLAEPAGMVWAQAIAVDGDGTSYLVGALWDGELDARPALVRVAADGAPVGMDVHESIGAKGLVAGLGRMSDGTVMIGGQRGEPMNDAFVASFAANGQAVGLSPLPGPGDRRIDALTVGALDELVVSGPDAAVQWWTTAISPGGSVMWDEQNLASPAGPTRLAVGLAGEVAVAHGRWSDQPMMRAELSFLDVAADTSWGHSLGDQPDIGLFSALAVRADESVVFASTRLGPPGEITLQAMQDATSLWKVTVLEEDGAQLHAHEVWQTPEGHTRVLVTRLAPADAPVEIAAAVLSFAADGATLAGTELALGLDVTRDVAPVLRAAVDPCGDLRVWDSPTRMLRSVKL